MLETRMHWKAAAVGEVKASASKIPMPEAFSGKHRILLTAMPVHYQVCLKEAQPQIVLQTRR